MASKRPIDERDIDDLLASLTDRQIAKLFGMSDAEVAALRRDRRLKTDGAGDSDKANGSGDLDGAGDTDESA